MEDHPRVEHLLENVKIWDTLTELGVLSPSEIQERNISCPFHGFGQETRASARCYHESENCPSGLFHCFTCGKTWTPITFVQDFLHLSFWDSLKWLERKFDVTPPTVEEVVRETVERVREPLKRVTHIDLEKVLDAADALLYRMKLGVEVSKFRLYSDLSDLLRVQVVEGHTQVAPKVRKFLANLKRISRESANPARGTHLGGLPQPER